MVNLLPFSDDCQHSQVILSALPDKAGVFLGRNLKNGAYKNSRLTACFNQAMRSNSNEVFFSDYEYNSTLGKTVAFMCTKQFAEFDHLSEGIKVGETMGVVVTALNLNYINKFMTQRVGMGKTGQAYLLGEDHILRSDFYLEKDRFNVNLAFQELKPIETPSIALGSEGKTGNIEITDPTGSKVLSFYTPVDVFGKKWIVIAEQQVNEVLRPVYATLAFTAVAALILLLVILVSSYFLTQLIVNPVVRSSAALQRLSEDVTVSSSSMKSNSETLSKGSDDLSRSIQSTFSVLEELKAMVKTNLQHVTASTEKGAQSREKAESGQHSVGNMIDAMDQIDVANTEIVGVMNEISDKMTEIINEINKIASKTNVINDIVFQTKLLSFNASVEAARAGEHGKGFAVVAEEVGNLASASGTAAKEISVMLDSSIQKVEAIVDDTKHKIETISKTGQETVKIGSDTAKECGKALEEILQNVSDVNLKINEISSASNEQVQGIEGVSKSMNEVDEVTKQTSSIALETLTGSENLANGASSLITIVDDLNILVHGKNKSKKIEDHSENDPVKDASNILDIAPASTSKTKVSKLGSTPKKNDRRFKKSS